MSYADIGSVNTGDPTKTSWANQVRLNQEYFNSIIGLTAIGARPCLEYLDDHTIGIKPGSRGGFTVSQSETSLETFDSATGWSYDSGTGTISIDSVNQVEGSGMLRFTKTSTGSTTVRIKKTGYSLDLSLYRHLRIYLDIESSDLANIANYRIYLSSHASTLSDYYRYDIESRLDLRTGGIYFQFNPVEYSTSSGSPDLSNIQQIFIEIVTNNATDTLTNIGIDEYVAITGLNADLTSDLDIGSEENSVFYYIYLEDETTPYFSKIAPVATRLGMHPWNEHPYLGCVYNYSSGDILPFIQEDKDFYLCGGFNVFSYSSSSPSDHGWIDMYVWAVPPNMVGKFCATLDMNATGGQEAPTWLFGCKLIDGILYTVSAEAQDDNEGRSQIVFDLPVSSLGVIRHYRSADGCDSLSLSLRASGWVDSFLV